MPEETEEQEPEVKTFDEDYVRSLRSESAKHRSERNELRKTVEELDAKLKGYEDKSKSEVERITEEKTNLERELSERDREIAERDIRMSIERVATRAGIEDTDVAYKLVDLSLIDPEEPKSISKAVAQLVKDKPYLLKSAPPTPGAGGPPVQGKPGPEQQFLNLLKQGAKR